MRDDGKGFATSPLIPEPSDPNHPVPFKMLTETEASVNNARDDVIKTAQQVAANTQAVVQNTQITATNTQTAQQAATSALSSRQSADESENMARKWASNPENEVVLDEKYSAYHYAQKAAQLAANLASAESSATQSATIATQKAEEATQAAKKAESLAVGEVDYAKVLNVPRSNINTEGIVQLSSATNSDSETEAATSKAVKTAYDKAVEAKTTADGKVGLSGNEEIAGDKLFRSQTKFQNGVLISANKGHWDNGYKVYIGADSDNAHLVFGDDTLRLHGSNHRISYNNYHLFHEGYKPRFNEHIINKPNTLAGYGIGNFKVEQGQGDANGYKTDGNYYLASGQNLPENGAWHIEVVSGGATNAVRQIARKANDNKIKTRFFNGSNWSEWKETGGDGVPIGAVVSFPRAVTNPVGFLKADGTTFNQQTFPDLYRTLGDSNQLPDLTRSDVGMTAYFAVDNIPSGWIAFDSIRSTVTQQNYPELYQYLVDKYSSISNVPLAEDRFIRNTGNGLNIGQTQSDEIKKHVHRVRTRWADSSDSSIFYDKTKTVIDSRLRTATTTDDNLSDNGFMHPLLDSPMATGGAETRPRAIALKLCIKAKNTFDDVQFWVKAFGVVENVGALDAGTLAQNMQALSARVDQEIEENKQYTLREITNAKADINQQFLQAKENLSQIGTLKTVWQGNVGSGRIDISEKCFGKTLILYLQSSERHRLDDNNDIELVSFEVGAEIEGKTGGGVHWLDVRQVRGFPRNGSFLNYVEVKTFAVTVDRNGTAIQIQDLAGFFVKRIDIR
ncbi:pyocin knob domain-containing protein [Haemophilus influenzae]|uniref:pyocin knob domain-containing protein n=1 Tax=Haemophilus influenzae TaxID=727 RepID=UPI000665D242|nr:pyocin knob domain-containing protein [Haemophilus influenzae]